MFVIICDGRGRRVVVASGERREIETRERMERGCEEERLKLKLALYTTNTSLTEKAPARRFVVAFNQH